VESTADSPCEEKETKGVFALEKERVVQGLHPIKTEELPIKAAARPRTGLVEGAAVLESTAGSPCEKEEINE